MDVTLTEQQEEIRAAAARFLSDRCPLAHARAMAADDRGYDPRLWEQMAELGWLGLAVPDEYGGLGEGFLDLCLLIEEQGRHLVPSPFVTTVALGGQALARYATPDKRAEYLPAIADGQRIIGIARIGPDGSWDPKRVGVTATREQGGYTVDGAAAFVDYAGAADVFIAIAEMDGALTAFLVPATVDGIAAIVLDTNDGVRTHRVVFSQAQVSEDAVLGRVGQGDEIARALASWGAVARCAELVGIGRRVLEMTVAYATEREAFGSPIGTFQAIQHHCADMAVAVLSASSVAREAAWRVSADDAGADEAVHVAKAWASDAIAQVCALGHQVHGAIGFTAEHDLHLLTRRARGAELDFGDAGWHRSRLAARFGL